MPHHLIREETACTQVPGEGRRTVGNRAGESRWGSAGYRCVLYGLVFRSLKYLQDVPASEAKAGEPSQAAEEDWEGETPRGLDSG